MHTIAHKVLTTVLQPISRVQFLIFIFILPNCSEKRTTKNKRNKKLNFVPHGIIRQLYMVYKGRWADTGILLSDNRLITEHEIGFLLKKLTVFCAATQQRNIL